MNADPIFCFRTNTAKQTTARTKDNYIACFIDNSEELHAFSRGNHASDLPSTAPNKSISSVVSPLSSRSRNLGADWLHLALNATRILANWMALGVNGKFR